MKAGTLAMLTAVIVFTAGCSTAGDDGGTSTTTSTTEPASSSTTAPTTSTTLPPTTTAVDPFAPDQPITLAPPASLGDDAGDGSSGSGCSPGEGPLPDGVWFGFLAEREPTSITFDLACLWFGDIAYEVGEAAGAEVNNDVYIANVNDAVRDVPVSEDTAVWTLAGDTTEGHTSVPYAEWPLPGPTYTPCPGENCTVWLYVNGGAITEIVEQYLP